MSLLNQALITETKVTVAYYDDELQKIQTKVYSKPFCIVQSASNCLLPEIATCELVFKCGTLLTKYDQDGQEQTEPFLVDTVKTAKLLRGAWVKIELYPSENDNSLPDLTEEQPSLMPTDNDQYVVFVGRIYDINFTSSFGGSDVIVRATDVLGTLTNRQSRYAFYRDNKINVQIAKLPPFNPLVNGTPQPNCVTNKVTGNLGDYTNAYFENYGLFINDDVSIVGRKHWSLTTILTTALQQVVSNSGDFLAALQVRLTLVDGTSQWLDSAIITIENKLTWLDVVASCLDNTLGLTAYLDYSQAGLIKLQVKRISDCKKAAVEWLYETHPLRYSTSPEITFADQDLCRGVHAVTENCVLVTTQNLKDGFKKGWTGDKVTENGAVGNRFTLDQTKLYDIKYHNLTNNYPSNVTHQPATYGVALEGNQIVPYSLSSPFNEFVSFTKLLDTELNIQRDLPVAGLCISGAAGITFGVTGGNQQLAYAPILFKKNAVDSLEVVNCQMEVCQNSIIIKQDTLDLTDDNVTKDLYLTFAVEVNPVNVWKERSNPHGSYDEKTVVVDGLKPILIHQNAVLDIDADGKPICGYLPNEFVPFAVIATQNISGALNTAADYWSKEKIKIDYELTVIPAPYVAYPGLWLDAIEVPCEPRINSENDYRRIHTNKWLYKLPVDCVISKIVYLPGEGKCQINTDWSNYR